MRVTFTKLDEKRYGIAIDREFGPALIPRNGPGYDDWMPHDLAHYLVEETYGIELGVWGQLAAGGGGIFSPAPWDDNLRNRRRAQRIGAIGRDDMVRSEHLVQLTMATWERTIGRPKHRIPHQVEVEPESLHLTVRRLGEVAQRWQRLQQGESLAFAWPAGLTFDAAKSQRGRRAPRRTPTARR